MILFYYTTAYIQLEFCCCGSVNISTYEEENAGIENNAHTQVWNVFTGCIER